MKKILSYAVLFVGLSVASFAQEAPQKIKKSKRFNGTKEMVKKSPEEIAKLQTDRLDKVLKFTDSQRKEVYSLYLEKINKRKQFAEVQRKENKFYQDKFESLLTNNQKGLLKEKSEGMKDRKFRGGDRERKGRRDGFDKKIKSLDQKVEESKV